LSFKSTLFPLDVFRLTQFIQALKTKGGFENYDVIHSITKEPVWFIYGLQNKETGIKINIFHAMPSPCIRRNTGCPKLEGKSCYSVMIWSAK
jgi:hypothetical protein